MDIDFGARLNLAQIAFSLSILTLIVVLFVTGKLDFKDHKKR